MPILHLASQLESIEREALTAGWKDARRAAHLVELGHEIWRFDQRVWRNTFIGREPAHDTQDAIEAQMRIVVRVAGRIDNYELWLRRHLLKPWWRRHPRWIPWPERYS